MHSYWHQVTHIGRNLIFIFQSWIHQFPPIVQQASRRPNHLDSHSLWHPLLLPLWSLCRNDHQGLPMPLCSSPTLVVIVHLFIISICSCYQELTAERPVPVTLMCTNKKGQPVSVSDFLVGEGLALRERKPMLAWVCDCWSVCYLYFNLELSGTAQRYTLAALSKSFICATSSLKCVCVLVLLQTNRCSRPQPDWCTVFSQHTTRRYQCNQRYSSSPSPNSFALADLLCHCQPPSTSPSHHHVCREGSHNTLVCVHL